MAEAFRAPNDACRVVLLLTLEAFGNVFFKRIVKYMEGQEEAPRNLQYFARHHLEVEEDHEILEENMEKLISDIAMSDEDRANAIALVERCHNAFHIMFDGICAVIATRKVNVPKPVSKPVSESVPEPEPKVPTWYGGLKIPRPDDMPEPVPEETAESGARQSGICPRNDEGETGETSGTNGETSEDGAEKLQAK
jgi:hypothetical protein